jgi:hypothetical protein
MGLEMQTLSMHAVRSTSQAINQLSVGMPDAMKHAMLGEMQAVLAKYSAQCGGAGDLAAVQSSLPK